MTLSPTNIALLLQARQNPRAALSQMVTELAEDDPQAAMIGQILAAQVDEDDADESHAEGVVVGEPSMGVGWADDRRLFSMREELDALQNRLDEQSRWLDELADRNRDLAAALGACPECWGADTRCTVCRGKGRPGSKLPHKKLFETYVLPALATVKSAQAKAKSNPNCGITEH
jgi:hypothetical protein